MFLLVSKNQSFDLKQFLTFDINKIIQIVTGKNVKQVKQLLARLVELVMI